MHDNLNTITLSFREELEYVTAKGNNVTKIVWTKISNLTAINMACHKFFFFFFITIKSLPLIFHQCLKSILGVSLVAKTSKMGPKSLYLL